MRSATSITLFLLLLLASGRVAAQGGLLKRGDQSYEAFSYVAAIELYEQAFRKDASSIPHARRLADSYWMLRDARNAERWYAVVAASSQATPEDIYRYAELLRTSGQYADSELWLKRYARANPHDSRVRHKENAMERLMMLLEKEADITHKVEPAAFNSDHADISPFIHGDTVLFSSNRVDQYTSKNLHSWNGQPFLRVYTGRLGKDGAVTGIQPFSAQRNASYHESNAIISHDGGEMYFTRNNHLDGRKTLSDEGVNNLQIFVRQRTHEGWSKEKPFTHNSSAYSTGHPALTRDGKRLYFTSDKAGGIGGKDIYVCYREDAGGSWSEPENLGPTINTEGDEMFPYVHDNLLYFASDGHLGLGGLDIFRTTIRERGFDPVENVGPPVNSAADDFGLCLDRAGDLGLFCSDRDDALGRERIYHFRMHSKPEEDRVWAGRVLDVGDAQPIPYLTVRMLNMERKVLATTVTGADGRYTLPAPDEPAFVSTQIPGGSMAEIQANEFSISLFGDTDLPDLYLNSVLDLPVNVILRDGMTNEWLESAEVLVRDKRDGTLLMRGLSDESGIVQGQIPDRRYGDDLNIEVSINRPGYLSKKLDVDFRVLMFMEQSLFGPEGTALTPVSTGVDMALAMNLKPIYFDYRDHRIRPDAAQELAMVVQAMKDDPSLSIDLRSHTDSRASTEYNDALSQRRAQSTRDHMVAQGISPVRISFKGYGERRLVNHCADGTECAEEEHQANRRTEFIITGCQNCPPALSGMTPP